MLLHFLEMQETVSGFYVARENLTTRGQMSPGMRRRDHHNCCGK
jgi:hypothetical protein